MVGVLFDKLRDANTPAFVTEQAWNEHGLEPPFLAAQPPPPTPPYLVRMSDLKNVLLYQHAPVVDTPLPPHGGYRGEGI